MAGSAMILPECRWMWQGVEHADSLVVNAHKWLGAVFDTSISYVRDPQHLIRVMSTNPSYLQSAADDQVKNLRDWGIPLGRRFRALKLWALIRTQGIEGLQARLRRDLGHARWLAGQVEAAPGWKVLAPVVLQTVCVRYEPAGVAPEALDAFTQDWCQRINASGLAYLTPATLEGRWMVRVSIGALGTERSHVEALWEAMRQQAEAAVGGPPRLSCSQHASGADVLFLRSGPGWPGLPSPLTVRCTPAVAPPARLAPPLRTCVQPSRLLGCTAALRISKACRLGTASISCRRPRFISQRLPGSRRLPARPGADPTGCGRRSSAHREPFVHLHVGVRR